MFKRKEQPKKQSKAEVNTQSAVQRDAELLKRKFPLSWIFSLLLFVLILLVIVLTIFYFAAGTARGTQYFLDKIDSETGLHLHYQQGNLKDGLLVTDIEFEVNETTHITVDEATVKVGWRAFFSKQLHLRYADIGHIDIVNTKPSQGKPFSYPTLKLPVNALLDKATIDKISYRQTGTNDVVLNNVDVTNVSWFGSKIKLSNGSLSYSSFMHFLNVKGDIDLQDDYPLDAIAQLKIDPLAKAHIAPLDLKVTGSLKHAIAKASTEYNGYPITADVDAQLLDSKLPFNGKIFWDKAKLPYLENENIILQKGIVNFSGTFNVIDMRVNTSLSANSIVPTGNYHGRAKIFPRQGLKIESVKVNSPEGNIEVEGNLDWQQSFVSQLIVNSKGYEVENIVPKDYKQYLVYAPQLLNGKLNFNYRYKNNESKQEYAFKLAQTNGELVNLQLIRGHTPNNPKIPRTWVINTNWQNYYREDVPNIGIIDTKSGQARISIVGKKISVDSKADLKTLHDAPTGVYDTNFVYNNKRININNLVYKGIAGDLKGSGQLLLATDKKPFSWNISADTNQFLLNKLLANSPVQEVSGKVTSKGNVKKTNNGAIYNLSFKEATLTALLSKQFDNRLIDLSDANGDAVITMNESTLEEFDVNFAGGANITNLPAGNWQAQVSGTPSNIKFKQLNYQGDIGGFDGSLAINLGDETNKSVNWDINGDLDKLDLQFFAPSINGIATGKLQTKGEWLKSNDPEKFGQLGNFNAKFDGSVDSDKLPKGNLLIDAKGRAGIVDFSTFDYKGEAGALNANGIIDTRNNIKWDASAKLNNFDLQYLLPSTEAIITGDITSSGKWLPPKKTNTTEISKQLNDFSVDFKGNIDTKKLPKGTLGIKASGSGSNYVIDNIYHNGGAGSLNASGTLDISNGYKWQLDANMNKLNLAYFNKNLTSNLTGSVATVGDWQNGKQNISIKQLNVNGQLKGEPITATGQLDANMHLPNNLGKYFVALKAKNPQQQYNSIDGLIDNLTANNLVVKWGNSLISSNGTKSNLQNKINIPSLKQLSDSFDGKLIGAINIVRDNGNASPTLFIDLLTKELTLPNISIADARITGKLSSIADNANANLANVNSQLLIDATNLKLSNRRFNVLNAKVYGSLSAHTIDVKVVNNQLDFSALFKGGYDTKATSWQGVIGNGKAVTKYTRLSQLQPAQIKLNFKQASILLAAHCWNATNDAGSLCLEQNLQASKNKGLVDLSLNQIDSQILSLVLPESISWDAKISGNTSIAWQQKQRPTINAELYSNKGKFSFVNDEKVKVNLPYKSISLNANSVDNSLKIKTNINSIDNGVAYADITVDPYTQNKPINGDVVLDKFDIAVFKPFFPNIRTLKGMTTLKGKVTGTLKQPNFKGNARLKNASISVIGMPINLTKFNMLAQFNGNTANVNGQFNSGNGIGKLSGNIDWRNKLQVKLNLKGNELLLSQPPLMTANINPDIDLIVKPSAKYLNMQGVISVPSATFRPPEVTQDIINTNPDVIVLDRRLSGNIEEILAISKPWSINSKIGIDLGNKVRFQGFGAELPLAGAIVINQKQGKQATAKGLVQVSRSTEVDAFGQSLKLNYAQLRFNGNVQKPKLSIKANKAVDGANVGLRVKGEITDPIITVFNDAGLTEQQAMNALATGRLSSQSATQVSEEGFRSEISNNLAAAGISFGLSGTRNITNQIGKAFGLQSLTVSAAGNSNDTSVNVTGYITPDLYVRYGIGVFSAQSKLSARYQLTRRVYVEATSAVENLIDVVYSWRF